MKHNITLVESTPTTPELGPTQLSQCSQAQRFRLAERLALTASVRKESNNMRLEGLDKRQQDTNEDLQRNVTLLTEPELEPELEPTQLPQCSQTQRFRLAERLALTASVRKEFYNKRLEGLNKRQGDTDEDLKHNITLVESTPTIPELGPTQLPQCSQAQRFRLAERLALTASVRKEFNNKRLEGLHKRQQDTNKDLKHNITLVESTPTIPVLGPIQLPQRQGQSFRPADTMTLTASVRKESNNRRLEGIKKWQQDKTTLLPQRTPSKGVILADSMKVRASARTELIKIRDKAVNMPRQNALQKDFQYYKKRLYHYWSHARLGLQPGGKET